MKATRRNFICGCSAAIAAMSGARFRSLSFGAPGGYNDNILVVVFLRGGIDGLNLVPPTNHSDRGHYEVARPDLAVPPSGTGGALGIGGGFGFHPSAAPLFDLYQSNHVAVVHAVGMTTSDTRSHFDAQDYIELGTPGTKSTGTGWLARHLASAENLPATIPMPALSIGSIQQTALLGETSTVNMESIGSFNINEGPWLWRSAHRAALRHLYTNGTSQIHLSGLQALDALDIIEINASGGYTPSNGAVYPSGSFGNHLELIAQMTKLNLGLRVATLDLGGWDTHNNQGDGAGGYFAGNVAELAEGLYALYTDLDGAGANNYTNRLTVVVQSEFGRRLKENNDGGTDHGHGNAWLVVGGQVNGGIHGTWPGLANGQLFDNSDLEVTTDYRRILSEILIRRLENAMIEDVFPGYGQQYATEGPLGIVQGTDLPVDSGRIFSDGFEDGSMQMWS